MQIRSISAPSLTRQHLETWEAVLLARPEPQSPFLCPQFSQLIASVQRDVEVGVFEQNGAAVGFFPFQRLVGDRGVPVGGPFLNWCQAVVVPEGVHWNARQLIKACGLQSWSFRELVAGLDRFRGHLHRRVDCPYIDLSGGIDSYLRSIQQRHKKTFQNTMRCRRLLERELGPLHLRTGLQDESILETFMQWKTEHHQRTGAKEIYSVQWIQDVLRAANRSWSGNFSAELFALFAGKRIVAIHFVLRSRDTVDGWGCTYDRGLYKYSPGNVMRFELLRHLAEAGVTRFVMGRGEEDYKERFSTGTFCVWEGVVEQSFIRQTARRSVAWAKEMVRHTALETALKGILRRRRRTHV